MTTLDTLVLRLTTDLSGLDIGMKRAEAVIRTSTYRINSMLLHLGTFAVGAILTRSAIEFDKHMTATMALMADGTDAMRQSMEDTALAISSSSITAPTELAQAYHELARAGYVASQSIEALSTVERLSAVTHMTAANTARQLTMLQRSYGTYSPDPERNAELLRGMADSISRIATVSGANPDAFVNAVARIAPSMAAANQSMEQSLAILASFTRGHGDAGRAARQTMYILDSLQRQSILSETTTSRLQNRLVPSTTFASVPRAGVAPLHGYMHPVQPVSHAWRNLGIEVFDASQRMRPLVDILSETATALSSMSTETRFAQLITLGFTRETAGAVLELTHSTAAMREFLLQAKNADGFLDNIYNKHLESFSAQWSILRNNIEHASILILRFAAPALREINAMLIAAVKWWTSLPSAARETTIVMGLIAAALASVRFVLPIVIALFKTFISPLTALLLPLRLLTIYAVQFSAVYNILSRRIALLKSVRVTWGLLPIIFMNIRAAILLTVEALGRLYASGAIGRTYIAVENAVYAATGRVGSFFNRVATGANNFASAGMLVVYGLFASLSLLLTTMSFASLIGQAKVLASSVIGLVNWFLNLGISIRGISINFGMTLKVVRTLIGAVAALAMAVQSSGIGGMFGMVWWGVKRVAESAWGMATAFSAVGIAFHYGRMLTGLRAIRDSINSITVPLFNFDAAHWLQNWKVFPRFIIGLFPIIAAAIDQQMILIAGKINTGMLYAGMGVTKLFSLLSSIRPFGLNKLLDFFILDGPRAIARFGNAILDFIILTIELPRNVVRFANLFLDFFFLHGANAIYHLGNKLLDFFVLTLKLGKVFDLIRVGGILEPLVRGLLAAERGLTKIIAGLFTTIFLTIKWIALQGMLGGSIALITAATWAWSIAGLFATGVLTAMEIVATGGFYTLVAIVAAIATILIPLAILTAVIVNTEESLSSFGDMFTWLSSHAGGVFWSIIGFFYNLVSNINIMIDYIRKNWADLWLFAGEVFLNFLAYFAVLSLAVVPLIIAGIFDALIAGFNKLFGTKFKMDFIGNLWRDLGLDRFDRLMTTHTKLPQIQGLSLDVPEDVRAIFRGFGLDMLNMVSPEGGRGGSHGDNTFKEISLRRFVLEAPFTSPDRRQETHDSVTHQWLETIANNGRAMLAEPGGMPR